MKGLLRRFKYYGIGFAIGLIFVIFFFQNRGCAWLPANRVKNTLLDKVLVVPETEKAKIEADNISNKQLISFLDDGSILFSESLKDQNKYPKVYIFEKEFEGQPRRVQFSIYEDSYIAPIHYLGTDQTPSRYEELTGVGDFIKLPRDSALVFIDKSNHVQCKSRPIIDKDKAALTQFLKESGQINFSKSNLMLPKAEHHISFMQNDTSLVQAKTIWFESRITFKDFYWDYKLDCE